HAPQLAGLLPDEDGAWLVHLLGQEGQDLLPVPVAGAVRVATIILEDSSRATVLNEPGPTVGEAEAERLLEDLERHLAG
ncbi:MAG: hypothetical protein JOZ82_06815, partial [Marmoricola sp.]|nr:hypothetical protein [Marmoricola sp.]